MRRLLVLAFVLFAFGAQAQNVTTNPAPKAATPGQGTIGTTNTWQAIATGVLTTTNPQRGGCMLLNTGSHTMYVYFGTTAPASAADEYLPLNPISSTYVQPIYCGDNNGIVNILPVWITGTSGDTYVYLAY